MELFATIFAGLGLFFIGLNSLTKGMRAMSSRSLHRLVQSATSSVWRSMFAGILTGAATQSTMAVTFISVSMVSSGLIGLLNGLLVTAWSNIGSTLLVFVATLNIHVFLEIFIGILGMSYYFGLDRSETRSHLLSALVGIALLMLGLFFIKQGASHIQDIPWVMQSLSMPLATNVFMLVAVGILMSLITQSASSASAIVVSLVSSQLFDLHQACSLMLGANLGAGISVYFIGRNLTGSARKIVLVQTVTKVGGVLLIAPLLYGQLLDFDILIQDGAPSTAVVLTAVMLFVLAIQFAGALGITLVATPFIKLLNRVVPENRSEEIRKPRYLHSLALNDGESALDLLEKEHFRIISYFPDSLSSVRPSSKEDPLPVSLQVLLTQCNAFCLELMTRSQNEKTLERVLKAQKRNDQLIEINQIISVLNHNLNAGHNGASSAVLKSTIQESLHFVLMCLDDAKNSEDELETLLRMTGDKSTIMERTRETLVKDSEKISEAVLSNLLAATSQFERLIWLIHHYARGLKENGNGNASAAWIGESN